MESKVCNKCKIEQNINEFYKDTRTRDGHITICKTCDHKYKFDWKRKKYGPLKKKKYKKPSKSELQELYKSKNVPQIAEYYSCPFVVAYRWLKSYHIHEAKSCNYKDVDKEILTDLYCNQKLSKKKIAEIFSCSQTKLTHWLDKHNIKRRTLLESMRLSDTWSGCEEIQAEYWNQVVNGAKSRGLCLEVTVNEAWELFLKQNRICSLTGLELQMSTPHSRSIRTASFDRIDSNEGYTKNNVQWVHKDVNKMKMNFNENYFIDFCKLVAKHRA